MGTFGERLKQARIDAGYTAKTAALEIGISPSKLSRIENNHDKAEPLIAHELANACRLYNRSADWLLGIIDEELFRPDLQLRLRQIPAPIVREFIEREIYVLFDLLTDLGGLTQQGSVRKS